MLKYSMLLPSYVYLVQLKLIDYYFILRLMNKRHRKAVQSFLQIIASAPVISPFCSSASTERSRREQLRQFFLTCHFSVSCQENYET